VRAFAPGTEAREAGVTSRGTETVGANPASVSEALAGVTSRGVLTLGANSVRTRLALAGVTSLGVATEGAAVVRTRETEAGASSLGVATVGANSVRTRPNVSGVTTTGRETDGEAETSGRRGAGCLVVLWTRPGRTGRGRRGRLGIHLEVSRGQFVIVGRNDVRSARSAPSCLQVKTDLS